MIALSWLTTHSNSSMSSMLDVSKFLKFEMMSSMNADSWLLFGAKVSFNIWMISLNRGISTERGA